MAWTLSVRRRHHQPLRRRPGLREQHQEIGCGRGREKPPPRPRRYRPADGPCAGGARRAHHRGGRDVRRHRRRRGRSVSRPRPHRSLRAVSERPRLRRAAADDDDGAGRQRPRHRGRRHVRRLPGHREGLFNHHGFRDQVRLSGVNSINWARIVAQVVSLLHGAATLGAPHRKVAFTVPTGNFGDIFAGLRRAAHGPAGRSPGGRHQRQRHPGAHAAATGTYEVREVVATSSPSMDIQVSSNFERLLFEACGRDAAQVRGLMASLAQSGRFSVSSADARQDPRTVLGRPRRRERDRGRNPHHLARDLAADRSAHRGGARCRRERNPRSDPRSSIPMIVLGTAHPAKFPDAVNARLRHAPRIARMARRSHNARPERATTMPVDQGANRKIHPGGEPCRA